MDTDLVTRTNALLSDIPKLDVSHVPELRDIIREHNRRYYNEQSPIISDAEYDDLFKALRDLEERNGIFEKDSPTGRVDVLVSNQFKKGAHLNPMISLDNTYDADDLRSFEKRILNILKEDTEIPYDIELKFDGLGISLTYRNGMLEKALTRGSGVEGEDVTVNALQIRNIPKTMPFVSEEAIEIRGEVVMPFEAFRKLNENRLEKGEKLFANPRNAASGSLRQLDYMVTRERDLEFFAYSFPYAEGGGAIRGSGIDTYANEIRLLRQWGFHTSPYLFHAANIDEVVMQVEHLTRERPDFPFDTDGLVIKIDRFSLWKTLGTTEHHPRYAIAYKFPAMHVRTRVIDIEHSVGRTGIVTPIAHLAPVNVSGVMVSRATLHNYDELSKKDVRIGDSVFIMRAGEVIPEVVSVIPEARSGSEIETVPPTFCPSCETPLKRDEGKIAWYCPNKKGCPAQTLGSLISFASKHAANIEGLGEKIIEIFVEKGIISDFASIYELERHQEAILAMEGFKEKKLKNLLDEVEGSRSMSLARFFVALGIPQVGRKTAKVLNDFLLRSGKLDPYIAIRRFGVSDGQTSVGYSESLDSCNVREGSEALYDAIASVSIEDLQQIRDIGPVAAHSIVYYFEQCEDSVRSLLRQLAIALPEKSEDLGAGSPLAGKSFCVSGSFDGIGRDEIHSIIEENGGEVRTSVSSKLDYLIVGNDAGSKLAKAKELGVAILDLPSFRKML